MLEAWGQPPGEHSRPQKPDVSSEELGIDLSGLIPTLTLPYPGYQRRVSTLSGPAARPQGPRGGRTVTWFPGASFVAPILGKGYLMDASCLLWDLLTGLNGVYMARGGKWLPAQ